MYKKSHCFKKAMLSMAMAATLRPVMAGDELSLEVQYPSIDLVPEQFRSLYSERDGAVHLTAVVGLKTQTDVNKVMEALNKERNDHRTVKSTLARLGDRPIDEILADLDRIPALTAAAEGKDVSAQIETRLTQETAPLKRTIAGLTSEKEALAEQVAQYKHKETVRTIGDAVGQAALSTKALPEAISDISLIANGIFEVNEMGQVVAKDGIPGVTPGISPEVWMIDMKRTKAYYWPASQGAGARGGNGSDNVSNPWSKDNWNLTEQGRIIKENRVKAEQLAASAGTKIGAGKPAK